MADSATLEFKIGDRVEVIKKSSIVFGLQGVIVGRENAWLVVEFDPDTKLNSLRGNKPIWGFKEDSLKKVEGATLKTWEMLRDIKPGEIWQSDNVHVTLRDGDLVWCYASGKPDSDGLFTPSKAHLAYEWRKVPKLVDFAEAWVAYEAGKTIRPESVKGVTGTYTKGRTEFYIYTEHIRGKWEILD